MLFSTPSERLSLLLARTIERYLQICRYDDYTLEFYITPLTFVVHLHKSESFARLNLEFQFWSERVTLKCYYINGINSVWQDKQWFQFDYADPAFPHNLFDFVDGIFA